MNLYRICLTYVKRKFILENFTLSVFADKNIDGDNNTFFTYHLILSRNSITFVTKLLAIKIITHKNNKTFLKKKYFSPKAAMKIET
jgi:hypothetical protein